MSIDEKITAILGKSVVIFLKDRANDAAAFHFKVSGSGDINGKKYLDGYDAEHLNLRIDVDDIEFIG